MGVVSGGGVADIVLLWLVRCNDAGDRRQEDLKLLPSG
jgi:hypothetical protein